MEGCEEEGCHEMCSEREDTLNDMPNVGERLFFREGVEERNHYFESIALKRELRVKTMPFNNSIVGLKQFRLVLNKISSVCTIDWICVFGISSPSPVNEENRRCIARAQFNATGASNGISGARYFNVA